MDDTYTKKINRIARLAANDPLAISDELDDINERLDEAIEMVKTVETIKGDSGDSIEGPAGRDGEDGYTPIKGVDYFDGKDGSDGLNGKDGKPGRDGKDGREGKDGNQGERGIDGSPDSPKDIVKKINVLEKAIERKAIKGLEILDRIPDIERIVRENHSLPVTTGFFNGLRAKNLTVVGATAIQSGDTVILTIPSTGGGALNIETPSGTIDGSNTVFTVSNTPKYIVVDGVSKFVTIHYSYSSGTITITDEAPPTKFIRSFY